MAPRKTKKPAKNADPAGLLAAPLARSTTAKKPRTPRKKNAAVAPVEEPVDEHAEEPIREPIVPDTPRRRLPVAAAPKTPSHAPMRPYLMVGTPAQQLRFAAATPSIVAPKFSPARCVREKLVVLMCLKCSKLVFTAKLNLHCTRLNVMTRCDPCSAKHCPCLPIPKFAIRRFNRLLRAHACFLTAWGCDTLNNALVKARSAILEQRQKDYTAFVKRGKNVLRRHYAIGTDIKPVKVNEGLALLEIASNLKDLRRTIRHGNDLTKALNNNAVVAYDEYESSESELESDAYPSEEMDDDELLHQLEEA
ncbi:hypothetical protein VF21_08797 [Pseudogymnoascus sp. 05NY08]|nr:hypothetical protein VF21_08797 [Pseudogymnoascus sp. 05NY08]